MSKDTPFGSNVQGHPASPDAYLKHGWKLVPIPPGTKGPNTRGWNREGASLYNALDLPPGYGVGLAHAYSETLCIDIDHWELAAQDLAAQGINLKALYDAPDAVTIESGRVGRGKLLYKMPFGLVLPSKKLIHVGPDGTRTNYLDFRCGTKNDLTVQDVLPPTVHPDTGQPYRWGGRGHWSRLPPCPPLLLDYWNRLLAKDTSRTIDAGVGEIEVSWDDIKSALSMLSPNTDRDSWLAIGMALHWAGTQSGMLNDALLTWDQWSRGPEGDPCIKYRGLQDLLNSWTGFNPEGGRTLGTLFHMARKKGWKRPVPPASEIFKDVTGGKHPKAPVEILTGFRPPPPAPDMSLWPPLLARRAEEVASAVGCDPLVSLWAALSAVSGAADARIRLELVPGFQVPPVLWLMTLGNPSDKKTPGSKKFFTYLYEIEKKGREEWKPKFMEWEAKEQAYKIAREKYLEHYSDPLNLIAGTVGPEIPDLPPAPVPTKIVVQDITSQKLIRHCAERPRGLLCYLDEMHAWARKCSDLRHGGDDRSAWVQAHECERYEMDRVGSGVHTAENYAVSIYGNLQPDVFRRYIKPLSEDGLLQRFLPAILRPDSTWKGNPVPDIFGLRPKWEALLQQVFDVPEQTYVLSPGAHALFSAFQDWVLVRQKDERLIAADLNYQKALGKIVGNCGRLCLLFHMIENPGSPDVAPDTMNRTIRAVKEYVIPALRYAYTELAGSTAGVDDWLVSHIIKVSGEDETISLADLRLSAGKLVADQPIWEQYQQIRDAAAVLEKCDWLRCIEDKPTHHHTIWAINPALAQTYTEYRQQVMRIREKILEENKIGRRKAKAAGFTDSLDTY